MRNFCLLWKEEVVSVKSSFFCSRFQMESTFQFRILMKKVLKGSAHRIIQNLTARVMIFANYGRFLHWNFTGKHLQRLVRCFPCNFFRPLCIAFTNKAQGTIHLRTKFLAILTPHPPPGTQDDVIVTIN